MGPLTDTITRILEQKYPELASGWHLPMWATVVEIGSQLQQETVTEETPVYAVDLQLLKPEGTPDLDVPVFEQIPLPAAAGGTGGRGQWSKPETGTWVELAFAYGSPAHPFVRCILPHGRQIPAMHQNSQRWQHSHSSYQQVDENGNWQRETDQDIKDIAQNLTELVTKTRTVQAQKLWTGNSADNIYQLLLELMQNVELLAKKTASHGHPYTWSDPGGASVTSAPISAASFNQSAQVVNGLAGKLSPMIK